ncbi:hypothetical protein JTE90_000408 [Oedothorax gibbosus]|uniref:Uncharacterized protein n=1 Tax=Oedothorax gibbosus TaxID=931172 RepID=A0AAV6UTH6_9ARAC|nr:hypothetical protein JTE90_000408 [Oedothorax gibbosus]
MDRYSPYSSPRDPQPLEGRHSRFGGRNGLRYHLETPRRIFPKLFLGSRDDKSGFRPSSAFPDATVTPNCCYVPCLPEDVYAKGSH